jgi:hypothetical protein
MRFSTTCNSFDAVPFFPTMLYVTTRSLSASAGVLLCVWKASWWILLYCAPERSNGQVRFRRLASGDKTCGRPLRQPLTGLRLVYVFPLSLVPSPGPDYRWIPQIGQDRPEPLSRPRLPTPQKTTSNVQLHKSTSTPPARRNEGQPTRSMEKMDATGKARPEADECTPLLQWAYGAGGARTMAS